MTLAPPPVSLLRGASLFLDFDGTLVELAPEPDAVVVDDRLRRLLASLEGRFPDRLALLSGRSVAQLHGMLGAGGRFAIGGSHGAELRWADGRTRLPGAVADLEPIYAEMEALRARHPAVVVERKTFGAGLHYRLAPEAEAEAHALAAALAAPRGLVLQPGKMMIEIRAGGADKGSALTHFMGEAAMAGTHPVFLGDDLTDEAGFRAAAALGGAGILVGPARDTAAAYRLPAVEDVRAWLEAGDIDVEEAA